MKDVLKKYNSIIKYFVIVIVVLVIILVLLLFCGNRNEKWVQNGNQISKGDITYEIGDYFDYDETNDGKITVLTNVKWKVLGVNNDGNLLIISTSNVEEISLGSDDDIEISKKDYIEGNKKLDKICEKYAQGENAISGRSVNFQDLNLITNVDKNYFKTLENTFTYYWANEENPVSKNHNNLDIYASNLDHNGSYIWFDVAANDWKENNRIGTETANDPTEIVTLSNTLYAYNFNIWNDSKKDYVDIMEKDTKTYNMIFSSDKKDKNQHWISTKFISATKSYSAYGYYVVKNADLSYDNLLYSSGNIQKNTHGVRAVITIK